MKSNTVIMVNLDIAKVIIAIAVLVYVIR